MSEHCPDRLSWKLQKKSEIMYAKGEYSFASSKLKLKKRRSKHRSCNMLMMGSFWSLAALTQQERRRKRIRRRVERRRRRRRGRDMWEFPVDLVTEILIRLPEKSLMRFKCVSKQWSSLISCRYFCDRVFTLTRQKQQQPRLYMSLLDEGGQRELLSLSLTSPDKTCFVVDQDLSIPGLGGFFLSGPRGLMCFPFRRTACIYNPSTKQLLTLPMVIPDIIAEEDQGRHPNRYYIGHDPVNDQYKLLCTVVISSDHLRNLKSEHWVFVLEAGGSWKKVVLPESYHSHVPFALGRSISSGSVVRYMAWRDNYHCEVVCFDVRSEELTTILVPRDVGLHVRIPVIHLKADLIEYGGKIAIFEHSYLKDGGETELWVLEKEWSRKKSLVLQPCQRHLVNDVELIVKGITQDGKVILAPPLEMSYGFYILCYDLQSNDLRKVEIQGIPQVWYDKEWLFRLEVYGRE
uniref:F-box/LRR-repeat protein n=1 Tax=Noccaea caerulescens TaxID=107243 RepID=A0A1J3FD99_NOCCA